MTESAGGLEAAVLDCWSSILEMPRAEVCGASHFFECGGDSLLAVELVGELTERLGVPIPLELVLLKGTFGDLLGACQELAGGGR